MMKYPVILVILLLCTIDVAAQKDCDGCADYPVLPRMPDFHITMHKEYEFDAEKFYINKEQTLIEGKKIKIEYTLASVATNKTEEGKQKNRRVEFVLK